MKKPLQALFLYKHRYPIGYALLGVGLILLLLILPQISPNGLSEAEMQSAVTSHGLTLQSALDGNVIDLPYHFLQKASIAIFGLSAFSIKLPSIIIGILLAILLILLLNRWFKNNVALLASILSVLSVPFLYVAGSGTPMIMIIFWPTLLLWLGSKIQGKTTPKPAWCFIFAFCLLGSIFTPHLIYLAIFICAFALAHPHLRFTIKSLPRTPFICTTLIIAAGLIAFGIGLFRHPATATALLFMENFSLDAIFTNLSEAFAPFFSWNGQLDSPLLSPLVGLPILAIAIIGLLSTIKGFFASRNSIASFLIIFTVILSALSPDSAVLLVLPLAILIAHGIRYILEKWYGLFPENPYARVFAFFPIAACLGLIVFSDLNHYIFGYRYNPPTANHFTNDLHLITRKIPQNTPLLVSANSLDYDFYKILDHAGSLTVISNTSELGDATAVATLGKWPGNLGNAKLTSIITSPKSSNSDRIYLYKF